MKPTLRADQLERIIALLAGRAGLVFQSGRREGAETEIAREMERVGLRDGEHYLEALARGGALFDELLGRLTVGETYFFREPAQLERFRREVLPDLLAGRAGDQPLRIWSAGCATGEEPYSIALLLEQEGVLDRARVLGTDVARARLLLARGGRYRPWSFRGVSPALIERFFETRGNSFVLAPAIRRQVEFRFLNLIEAAYPALASGIWGMDAIFCRNVLIYFSPETVAAVARRLLDSLGERGWLFLGAADPPLGDLVPCEAVRSEAGVAYRQARGRHAVAPAAEPRVPAAAIAAPVTTAAATSAPAVQSPGPLEPSAPDALDATRDCANRDCANRDCANRDYADRDYAGAALRAERALRLHPDDPELWVLLVRALANGGELGRAGRASAAAVERHPLVAELAYLQAVLLGEAGEWASSAEAARRSIYLDRSLAVAHLALGGALARLGHGDRARRAFRSAERILASHPEALPVPAADGETAGRLAAMARVQAQLIGAIQ